MRRLPPLPTVSDIIRLYGLSARSQLSQNFLLDLNVTDKMVRLAGELRGSCVCEVGPGPGALTRSILNAGPRVLIGIEKDRRFIPSLELLSDASDGRLLVRHEDALSFDWDRVCSEHVTPQDWSKSTPDLHIMGNLPFNVSIPLLLQWLAAIPKRSGPFKFGRCSLTLTFQKEVAEQNRKSSTAADASLLAWTIIMQQGTSTGSFGLPQLAASERILALPSDSQRSRLSIMCQQLCQIKRGFNIRGSVFVPKPKVDATVLRLTPLLSPVTDVDYSTLETVVKAMFQSRRKIIQHGAKVLFPSQPLLAGELFRVSGISDTLRPQQLTVEEFGSLTTAYQTLTRESAVELDSRRTPTQCVTCQV